MPLKSFIARHFSLKCRPLNTCREEGGFTLIETLVAFMILSVAVVIVLQLFSGSLRSLTISNNYERGVFYAEEKMESVLMHQNLAPGEFAGEFEDGYRWRMAIAPEREIADLDTGSPLTLLNIVVDVSWRQLGREKSYRLATQTLAKISENGPEFN